MKHTASLLMAAGLAAAQTTTVSILMPLIDAQELVGSVVSADSTATTFAISCPDGAGPNECGLPSSVTIVNGPETMSYSIELGDITAVADCSLNTADDEATCTGGANGSLGVDVLTGYQEFIVPVTITAGADQIGAEPTTTTAPPTATETNTPAPTEEPSGDAEPTTETSTGGLPRVTQNAVIMGAAALVGGAMML
ncbi:hypothetical protein VTK26DRAFT_252 [Humicola hyalothermophila]